MLVGHYSAAFVGKKFAPELPLWVLFVAVQLSDYVHFILKIFNFERSEIRPEMVGPLSMDLIYMPFSHSLAAATATSITFGALSLLCFPKKSSILLGLAVFSHWILDLFVHTPDLPLIFDSGTKVGLGLWSLPLVSILFEVTLLISSAFFFRGQLKDLRFVSLLIVMIVYQASFSLFLAPPPDPIIFSALALVTYTLFSYLAFWAIDQSMQGRTP